MLTHPTASSPASSEVAPIASTVLPPASTPHEPEPAHMTLAETFAATLRDIDDQRIGRNVTVRAVDLQDWLASLQHKSTTSNGGDR